MGIVGAAPIGTAFTYQGRLIDNNVAADGEYGFQFRLFDGDTGGSQVGGDVSIGDVNVIDGYFTVELDFGNVFTQEARWLEIGVKEGDSSGDFTTLSPRQKITAVPYAMSTNISYGTTSVVTGNFHSMDGNPVPVPIQIDLSSLGNISPDDVTIVASAFKLVNPPIGDDLYPYEPAFVRWEVTGPPLAATLRVYDKNAHEFDQDDAAWTNNEMFLSYIAAGPDSGTGILPGSKVVGGRISGMPPATYPFEFDISELGNVEASDVMVVASGSKLTGAGEPETPLMIKWDVNDSPLTVEFRVWDSYGVEYSPASGAWMGRQIEMSFTAFDPNGGGVLAGGSQAVASGRLEGICHDPSDAGAPDDTLPSHPFEFDISGLGAVEFNNIAVCITGFKMSGSGVTEGPLWFDWEVTTSPYPLTLRINVWDEHHNPYDFTDGINWEDKRLKLSYIASVASGSGVPVSSNVKVVTDLNLDIDGNIVTGEIPQYDYLGRVTRVYLRDLPNLKERLGGSGITLAKVNHSIKKIMLSAQTYLDATQDAFVGFRWARERYGFAHGTDETDIFWSIYVYEDEQTANEDTDATYKLIRVEAHLN